MITRKHEIFEEDVSERRKLCEQGVRDDLRNIFLVKKPFQEVDGLGNKRVVRNFKQLNYTLQFNSSFIATVHTVFMIPSGCEQKREAPSSARVQAILSHALARGFCGKSVK